jgi:2,4-dienoyl-CoA reductase-like NADH-dependent reductase (Old Yellow Enzyme family)
MTNLFRPYDLAGLTLPNRIVMAPMTRSRARDLVPDASTALYYAQRASAGLIISEGTPITPEGRGYLFTPGIYRAQQLEGWRRVTDAVHEAGGRIFAQLWHVGRISHVSHQIDGNPPVSSTSVRASTSTSFAYDEAGEARQLPCSAPRALPTGEIERVVNDYVQAALNALDSGFDGVELHGANGYLFEQFISAAVNDRVDQYGGSIENRLRFPLEVIDAVSDAIGSRRVGLRISPFGRLYDMAPYPSEEETWLTLAGELSSRDLAYLHLSDQHTIGGVGIPGDFLRSLRNAYQRTLMAAGGFDKVSGEAAIDANLLDLIAIGRPFIPNPDLVERLKNNWPIVEADRGTFYGGTGDRGYIDFPRYAG